MLLTFLLLFSVSMAQDNSLPLEESVLEHPLLSLRCRELLKDREKKKEYRQKLQALMQKNKKIISKVDNNKRTAKNQLELASQKLNSAIKEATKRLKEMEENIIRSGCPGIRL